MGRAVSDEILQQTVDAIARNCGNKDAAARELKLPKGTVWTRADIAERRGIAPSVMPKTDDTHLLALVESLRKELDTTRLERDEAKASLRISSRPHFTVRQDNAGRTSKIRVVCIGDAHDSPAIPDKSRFRWIGKYIRDTKPDIVVQIGDFATLDSLNGHIENASYSGKAKPTFIADMVSFNEALEAMDLPDGIERHCTLGNHERRLYLFEERAPEAYGMMQFELQRILERHKWTSSPYGQITYYGGVGFVHAAINSLGKTVGGKNAENTIANDSIHDLVIGHSHRERKHRAPKIGGNNYVQIVNVGCALPDGFIEDYAHHTLTGWSHGIADMIIRGGHVQDYNFVSMAHLGETYG